MGDGKLVSPARSDKQNGGPAPQGGKLVSPAKASNQSEKSNHNNGPKK